MNIACLSDYIFKEDLIALIAYWRMEDKFCENIKSLLLDNNERVVIFQGCTLESLLPIFFQCPYLTLVDNEIEETFIHSGEDLDITFLFQINWTYEI